MLSIAVAALSFNPIARMMGMGPKMNIGPVRTATEQLWCEDEYNSLTKQAEEICYVPPYSAGIADMESEGCSLLGDYGAGSRWACNDRFGSNAEEEFVSAYIGPNRVKTGALKWVHYVS